MAYNFSRDASSTTSWTNITELDDNTIGSEGSHSAAQADTTGSNISPSGDYSGSNANRGAVFVTF